MAWRILTMAAAIVHIGATSPAITLQDLEMVDDTMSVGSYIREVRAAPYHPDDYHKSYEREGDGEIGYSRKKSGGGKKGYQHFDSYHKKAGDNYEFEKQDSYGLDQGEQDGAYSHQNQKKADYRRRRPEDVEEVEQNGKERPEVQHEDLREGASDGNGGVEAYGHDPNDYVLPEKYSYGSAEEYNF